MAGRPLRRARTALDNPPRWAYGNMEDLQSAVVQLHKQTTELQLLELMIFDTPTEHLKNTWNKLVQESLVTVETLDTILRTKSTNSRYFQ